MTEDGTVCTDGDGDGYYLELVCDGPADCDDSDPALNNADADGDGYSTCDGDCDDGDGGLTPLTDTDGDQTPDCLDLCVSDPGKVAPGICGCGQPEPAWPGWSCDPGAGTASAGGQNVLYIQPDGTLWGWGWKEGTLPVLSSSDQATPSLMGTPDAWVSVAAHPTESFAVRSDGTLWSWGPDAVHPAQVGTGTDWKMLDGSGHVLALGNDGSLWAWGDNSFGQLGDGTTDASNDPIRIGTGTGWNWLSAGILRSAAIREDGSLWEWGGEGDVEGVPARVGTGSDWKQVDTGYNHTLAIRGDGSLWTWGENHFGQLGNGTFDSAASPSRIATGQQWKWVSAGMVYSLAVAEDGSLWCWGQNRYDGMAYEPIEVTTLPLRVGTSSAWSSVFSGRYYNVGLRADGSMWTWGDNFTGQLGLGAFANKISPVQLGSDTGWDLFSAGAFHTVGVKGDGVLYAWGVPEFIDDPLWPSLSYYEFKHVKEAPAVMDTTCTWQSISTGGSHTLAVRTDGTLWAWGDNSYGQLGTTAISFSQIPVRVGTAANWQQVSAGGWLSGGIRADGTLWGWGDGVNIPSVVGTGTGWSVVSAGMDHSLALRDDNTLWAWGDNSYNQLGTPSLYSASAPVRIGTSSNWIDVSAGTWYSMAVRSGGTLWSWGDNVHGQLGDGTVLGVHDTPAMAGTGTGWWRVFSGTYHSAAVRNDGSLWTWGNNECGQLGQGPLIDTLSDPGRVGTGTNWSSVDLGWGHTAAMKDDGSLWIWGLNDWGQLGDGTAWKRMPERIF